MDFDDSESDSGLAGAVKAGDAHSGSDVDTSSDGDDDFDLPGVATPPQPKVGAMGAKPMAKPSGAAAAARDAGSDDFSDFDSTSDGNDGLPGMGGGGAAMSLGLGLGLGRPGSGMGAATGMQEIDEIVGMERGGGVGIGGRPSTAASSKRQSQASSVGAGGSASASMSASNAGGGSAGGIPGVPPELQAAVVHSSDSDYDTDDRIMRQQQRARALIKKGGVPQATGTAAAAPASAAESKPAAADDDDYDDNDSSSYGDDIADAAAAEAPAAAMTTLAAVPAVSTTGAAPAAAALPFAVKRSSRGTWRRQEEFERVHVGLVSLGPLAQRSVSLFQGVAHTGDAAEQIFFYKGRSGVLGKMLVARAGAGEVHVRWVSYNTLLPGVATPYSEGECMVPCMEDPEEGFNFTHGGVGGTGGKGAYGTLSAEVMFTPEKLVPVGGCSVCDFNPHEMQTGDGYTDVCGLYDELVKDTAATGNVTIEEALRWQPPYVAQISDDGMDQIVRLLEPDFRQGGLSREQYFTLLDKLFGPGVFQTMAERSWSSPPWLALFSVAVKFMKSSHVQDALWDLVSRGPLARFELILQLIDALAVSQEHNVAAEFAVHVLFCGKETLSLAELQEVTKNIFEPTDGAALLGKLNDTVFKGGKTATRAEMRYAVGYFLDEFLPVHYFMEIVNELRSAWDW